MLPIAVLPFCRSSSIQSDDELTFAPFWVYHGVMENNNVTPKMMPRRSVAKPQAKPAKPANFAPRLNVTPVVIPQKVKNCTHVKPGAVWCQSCATANLAYARMVFEKTPDDVAKGLLRDALHEHSLTPSGLAELDQQYVNISAVDMARAYSFMLRITHLREEAAQRNKKARETAERQKARETTESSLPVRYVHPPRDDAGKMTTKNVVLRTTHHTSERMDEREIPFGDLVDSLRHPVAFIPQGRGRWKIIGENGVALCGFFEKHPQRMEFVSVTTYLVQADEVILASPNAVRL